MQIIPIKVVADHNVRTVLFTAQVQDRDGASIEVYVGAQLVTVGIGQSQRMEARLMWVEPPNMFLDLRSDLPGETLDALSEAGYAAYVDERNVVLSR